MSTHREDVARALPDYEIDHEIGRGEFGIVWRGRHRQLQRDVAVKQFAGPITETAEYTSRFRREARILGQLDHRHVVTVHDYREQGDLHLLVMEFLSGGTFAQRRATRLTTETAIASVIAAASGLQYVHEHGILHRDIKPENLMFDGRGTIKVTDFGIARGEYGDANAVDLTRKGEFFGTPAYVSPEQVAHALAEYDRAIDARSDQYGLAAVLYEALSGHLTHDATGGALALCNRRMNDDARPLQDLVPDVPPEICGVVMRALERNPDDRYDSTVDFAIALGTAATTLGRAWLARSDVRIRDIAPALESVLASAAPGTMGSSGAQSPTPSSASLSPAPPLPARLRPSNEAVFTGRAAERASWDDTWKRVLTGERRGWLVGGEAGMGKTSLIGHLAARALDDDAHVIYGRCDEDVGVPYQPWIESLTSLIEDLPDQVVAAHVDARGGRLARLVPALAVRSGVSVPESGDAEGERYALFGAVTDLLMRAANLRPTIVVLDDLHWADKASVQLLRHVIGVVEPMRLLVVGAYRPDDLGIGHALTDAFAPLRRERGVEFVDLRGLDDLELLDLMTAVAEQTIDDDALSLRDAIASETDGNPFFATEIVRHLLETGAMGDHDAGAPTAAEIIGSGLPVSVRQVVGERVSRLGPDAERLLRNAAVIGRDFGLGLLAAVADVDEDTVLDLLDAAVGAALVRNVGADQYSFAHALVEHTLYQDLTASRRARIHRRVAEEIEARAGANTDARVGELAYHWSSALVPDDAAKAIDYARRAGDRALEQLAPDEALSWFEKALQLYAMHGGGDRLHATLLVKLGDAQRQAGNPAHRETLLQAADAAQRLDDTELLVGAALAISRGWASIPGDVDPERIGLLERALDAVGPGDARVRSQLLATLAAELTFDSDLQRRRDVADEAIAIARRLDDAPSIVAALIGALSLPDRPGTAHLEWADEVIDLAQQLDDPVSLAIAAGSAVTSAASFADRERFERYLGVCAEAAARVGLPELVWRATGARSLEAIVDGDLERAEAIANEILPAAVDMGYALIWYGSIVITVRAQQGRGAEIRPILEGILTSAPGSTAPEVARVGMALADMQAGDAEGARRGFDAEADAGFPALDDQLWLTKICIDAYVCARLGDREHAGRLLELLEPNASLLPASPSVLLFSAAACAGMLAAILDDHDTADRHFSHAIALTTAFRAPYLLASAQLEWARALLQRVDPQVDQARTLLANALAAARTHGYGAIERDALLLQTAAD
jgi:serine/threonine protein kinase/tetratricopeptide (TPR) repeat protein